MLTNRQLIEELAKQQLEIIESLSVIGEHLIRHLEAHDEAATACRDSEHDKPPDPSDSSGKNGAEIAAPHIPSFEEIQAEPFPASDCVCGD